MHALKVIMFIGVLAMLPYSSEADNHIQPTIDTGGPYTDTLGLPLDLNASISSNNDAGAYPIYYNISWIFDAVGTLSISLGGSSAVDPIVSWPTLVAGGISATTPGIYYITFRAIDSYGNSSVSFTTLTEVSPVPEPVSIWLMLIGLCVLGAMVRFRHAGNLCTARTAG